MSKAKTEAQKLRDKRARLNSAGLPDLAPVKSRKRGKVRMTELHGAPKVDESVPALRSRCIRAGIAPTEAAMREARDAWMGCEAGAVLCRMVKAHDERLRLWDAIQRIRRVYAAHDRAMGAPLRHARSLRVMLPVDEMQTDADAPPLDMRDEQQRHDDAMRAWARLQSEMGRYGRYAALVTERCVVDNQPCSQPEAVMLVVSNVAESGA